MSIEQIKNEIPEFAKDIKLNLSTVLDETNYLEQKQILSIALACAYSTLNSDLIQALTAEATRVLTLPEIEAAKAAATIMAMNNVYYRFTHVMDDPAYASMPAKLRMNVIAKPGTDKVTFELASLAVSALNGCGKCMNAHAETLKKEGISKEAVQNAVRIASVINAAACSLSLSKIA